MASGVIKDTENNAFPGLSANDYYVGVADSTAPVISSLYPSHQSTGQANSDSIVVTFSEYVQVQQRHE